MNKHLSISLVLLFSISFNLRGQQPLPQSSPSPAPATTPQQQNPPEDDDTEVVRITANLVQIDAVVTKDGKHVTDLRPEDFEIFEDDKPQTITQFSYVTNVPAPSAAVARTSSSRPADPLAPVVPVKVRPNDTRRTIVLLVDDLGISNDTLGSLKQQLRKFLDKQLQPTDLVSIVTTGGKEVGVLQQFTTDKRILNSAIERLRWDPCSRGGTNVFGGSRPPPCSMYTMARTLQVLRFVLQGMRELPGRKSMVVFSGSLPYEPQEGPLSGFDAAQADQLSVQPASAKSDDPGIGDQLSPQNSASAMIHSLQKVAELAIRASVVIYAVDTRGLQPIGMQAMDRPFTGPQHVRDAAMTASLSGRSAFIVDGRQGGRLLAKETGGLAVFNSNDFGLDRVMDDQAGYYLIGYRPSGETFNRRFHHLRLRTKRGGLEVRTRKGFYGVSESEATAAAAALSPRDHLSKALLSPFGANDVSVRLTTIHADDPAKGSVLRSFLFLNASDLVFTHLPDGMHEAKFDLSSVLFGDYGRVVARRDEKVTLRLRQARYEQVMREGVVYKFDRPAAGPGNFQFRVALQDTASSRVGAAGQFIEIPNLNSRRLALSGILVGGVGGPEEELRSGPAVRQFQQGAGVNLVYSIYNASLDPNSRLPKLTAQTRIFRDGEVVYSGNVAPIDLTGQTDLQRIAAGAQLQLGSALTPGDYVLQVIVEDQLSNEKERTVTQWIDFAIVK